MQDAHTVLIRIFLIVVFEVLRGTECGHGAGAIAPLNEIVQGRLKEDKEIYALKAYDTV